MPIIGEELSVFIAAVTTGLIVSGVYYILVMIRLWIPHHIVIISVEDILYWIWTALYIFIKMHNTTYGSIRWYFILGVVIGAISLIFFASKCKKWLDKRRKKS